MAITKDEARLIISAIDGALGKVLERLSSGKPDARPAGTTRLEGRPLDDNGAIELKRVPVGDDFEKLYQQIKRRLLDECRIDPILLQLLTSSAPELRIEIEPRVLELNEISLRGRIGLLVAAGFFDGPRSQADTIRELRRTGSEPHSGRTSEAFTSLVNDGVLTREGDGYQKAPGVKVTKNEIVSTR